jgi:hypothetical protein
MTLLKPLCLAFIFINFFPTAYADIFFRNLTPDAIKTYYASISDGKEPVKEEYAFPGDILGDVNESTLDAFNQEITLGDALKKGVNQFDYVELSYQDGTIGTADFALYVPKPLIYHRTDNLMISVINKRDEAKYNVKCPGSSPDTPCALVKRISAPSHFE